MLDLRPPVEISVRSDHPPRLGASANPRFDLYVMDISYFSGKLECYFNFKELPHRRLEPTLAELEVLGREHTGTTQVPFVFDRLSATWLRDTTPIIERIEADETLTTVDNRATPIDPVLEFLAWLIEDYADESLWRLGMFYRWAPTVDADAMSHRFVMEFARELPWPAARVVPSGVSRAALRARQVMFSVEGEGIDSPEAFDAMEREYLQLLDDLDAILARSPFVMGGRPTVADFGLMGPFFRHLSHDPTPRKIMQRRSPNVYAWCARCFATRASSLGPSAALDTEISPELRRLLSHAAPTHMRNGRLNADAFARGDEGFPHDDGSVRPVVPYRVWSFSKLQERFATLPEAPRREVGALMRELGAWDDFFGASTSDADQGELGRQVIRAAPEGGVAPPACEPGRAPLVGEKWSLGGVLGRALRRRVSRRLR